MLKKHISGKSQKIVFGGTENSQPAVKLVVATRGLGINACAITLFFDSTVVNPCSVHSE